MTVDPRTVIRDKVAMALHAAETACLEASAKSGHKVIPGYTVLADAAISAHLEALEQAARIESVEQLTEAPPGTVIRIGDGPGGIYEKDSRGFWGYTSFIDDGGKPEAEAVAILADPWRGAIRVLYRPEETP